MKKADKLIRSAISFMRCNDTLLQPHLKFLLTEEIHQTASKEAVAELLEFLVTSALHVNFIYKCIMIFDKEHKWKWMQMCSEQYSEPGSTEDAQQDIYWLHCGLLTPKIANSSLEYAGTAELTISYLRGIQECHNLMSHDDIGRFLYALSLTIHEIISSAPFYEAEEWICIIFEMCRVRRCNRRYIYDLALQYSKVYPQDFLTSRRLFACSRMCL